MKIAMIAAMTKNRTIGFENDMPWHLPDDLKFFKSVTTGKPVIMGRRTFESIGNRPLPNRQNLVISRQADYKPEGVEVFNSVDAALSNLSNVEEVVIMGGGQLYNMMLPEADKLYLTLINATINGDTYFPDWTKLAWNELERLHHPKDERHAYEFDFVTLERK
jgi:dihydrofolate reductase